MADTIAAIATSTGRGGIGVVRLSGSCLHYFIQALSGKSHLTPRVATFSNFLDSRCETIDQGIIVYFAAPHSYTGEDVLELQCHGSPVVLRLLLQRCLDLGARLAEPGEFTRRAYLNDKIDLAQAEGIADLIEAATDEAAKSAIRSLKGEFSNAINELAEHLINLRMLVEASFDFSEDEIDFVSKDGILDKLSEVENIFENIFRSATQGSILREGMSIVLFGQPNVGKSSLLNCLAQQDIAIVTSVAGTTRDVIRQSIEIDGVVMHIVDTAGLRATCDEVETIGIERTWLAVESSNVAVLLIDSVNGVTNEDLEIIRKLPSNIPFIRVFNKIDLCDEKPRVENTLNSIDVYLSAKTGEGLDNFRGQLLKIIGWKSTGEGVYLARERHLQALRKTQNHLFTARNLINHSEFFAEELRFAQLALSPITGEFSSDDLLGEIFSRFCIGK